MLWTRLCKIVTSLASLHCEVPNKQLRAHAYIVPNAGGLEALGVPGTLATAHDGDSPVQVCS